MKIFTAQQMRDFDKEAVETYHIPSIVLMENAALRVVEFLEAKFAPLREKRVVVLCGKGNNGGDGLAIARHLISGGCRPEVFLFDAEDEHKGDALVNFRALRAMEEFEEYWYCTTHDLSRMLDVPEGSMDAGEFAQYELAQQPPVEAIHHADIIVDALLGTGFSGQLRDPFPYLLRLVGGSTATRVAVDLPSGLNADTGEAAPETVPVHYTVTFASPKRGMLVRDGLERCGEIWVGSISLSPTQQSLVPVNCQLLTPREWPLWPRALHRSRDAHKGDAGRVLVVGGSRGMSGAVALAARASLQIGAGLCLAAVPDAILGTVASSILEATTHPLACDERGALTEAALEDLCAKWGEMQAVAIGPGTGRSPSTWELVRSVVRECPVPLIVDADALHALPEIAPEVLARAAPTILTPHPGEMGVLLGKSTREVQEDRYGAVEECAKKYGAVTVLKGAYSLVGAASGEGASTWVNPTGNAGMATGGSGDVLTGTIAGLLAQTKDAFSATLLGVYLHGLAGDLAFEKHGNGLVAGDIAARLGAALLELEKPRGEDINERLRRLA